MPKATTPYNFARMKTLDQFTAVMSEAGYMFPVSEDLSVLRQPIQIGKKIIPNRLCIHPLEGFDGTPEGAPSDLVFRRYDRFARGGAGLIWYESITIADDGRCNPLQMIIKDSTVKEIKRLVVQSNNAAIECYGRRPYNVLQLTHSGRKSVDADWNPTPLAVVENPYIDHHHNSIDGRSGKLTIATDEKIEQIIEGFISAAVLSAEAGFDSVDIKVCHEYILSDLLAAFNRPGKFGGSFENRTRALFDIIEGIHKRVGNEIDICVRLNAYDYIPYPHGWGMVKEEGIMKPNLSEPIKLCRMLVEKGVELINISAMMPRYRPYGKGNLNASEKPEISPYSGTYELLKATKKIRDAVPGGIFVATGLTWMEQFGANVGAGGINEGWFDIAGFGRQALAYPDFARDIMQEDQMKRGKCCITCHKCYELIRKGHTMTGCVIRDQDVYLPMYRDKVLHQNP